MVTLEYGDFDYFILLDSETGETVLFQTDWDYPGLASYFGWRPCDCVPSYTDGTIDCPVCGKSYHEMILDAGAFLDDHIGDELEDDPGYFDQE